MVGDATACGVACKAPKVGDATAEPANSARGVACKAPRWGLRPTNRNWFAYSCCQRAVECGQQLYANLIWKLKYCLAGIRTPAVRISNRCQRLIQAHGSGDPVRHSDSLWRQRCQPIPSDDIKTPTSNPVGTLWAPLREHQSLTFCNTPVPSDHPPEPLWRHRAPLRQHQNLTFCNTRASWFSSGDNAKPGTPTKTNHPQTYTKLAYFATILETRNIDFPQR